MINVGWLDFKSFLAQRKVVVQYVTLNGQYFLWAFDGPMSLSAQISISDTPSGDQIDFETNFKSLGNKSPNLPISINDQPAFASKTLGTKKLYKRVQGIQQACTLGDNTILFTIPFPWVKITGIEVIAGEALDKISLFVLDTLMGTYSTIPNYTLNQFGYLVNVSKDYYEHKSEFDADL